MDVYKGGALTVGQLRRALEGIPDAWEVGTGILDLNGHVEKAVGLHLVRKGGFVVVSSSRHAGTFTEDEIGSGDHELAVKADPA